MMSKKSERELLLVKPRASNPPSTAAEPSPIGITCATKGVVSVAGL